MSTIFEQLSKQPLSAVTLESLNTGADMTFVDKASKSYWQGILILSNAVAGSRTYPHGLVIPEQGAIASASIDATATHDFQPPATEIWRVLGLSIVAASGTPTANVYLSDGSNVVLMHTGTSSTSGSSFYPFEAPFDITNSLFLTVLNADGSIAQTASIAYQKVGL